MDTAVVSIDDIDQVAVPAATTETASAPAPDKAASLAPIPPDHDEDMLPALTGFVAGRMSGDRTEHDLQLSRLQLLQKSSGIFDQTPPPEGIHPGDLVLDGKPMCKVGGSVNLVVLSGRKRFKQVLTPEDRKAKLKANIVDTKEDVLKAGGSLDREAKPPFAYEPLGTMLVLVESPEGADVSELDFPLEFEGKRYALAMLTVGGQTYRVTYGRCVSDEGKILHGKAPIYALKYRATSSREVSKNTGDTYYAVQFTLAGRNSPEFVAWAQSNLPS